VRVLIDRITLIVLIFVAHLMLKVDSGLIIQLVFWFVFSWWFDGTYVHISKVSEKVDKNDTSN